MRRRGLDPQRRLSAADPATASLREPFGSTVAGCGSRGPLAPHLAQAVAEGAGFEPAVPEGTPVLQTGGLDRSPTPPLGLFILETGIENYKHQAYSLPIPSAKSTFMRHISPVLFDCFNRSQTSQFVL